MKIHKKFKFFQNEIKIVMMRILKRSHINVNFVIKAFKSFNN